MIRKEVPEGVTADLWPQWQEGAYHARHGDGAPGWGVALI